jgi:hypothetical protein
MSKVVINLFKKHLFSTFLIFFSLNLVAKDDSFVINKGKVGKIEIGSSIDSFYGAFEKHGPLTLSDQYLEATFTPIIKIHDSKKNLVMKANIIAEDGKFSLGTIEIFSPKFYTTKKIRVGSSYEELIKKYKQIKLDHFHGRIFVVIKEEKLSFTLDFPVEKWPNDMNFMKDKHLKNVIPSKAKIKSIIVIK